MKNESEILEKIGERPISFIGLAKRMGIRRQDNKLFSKAIIQLVKSGKVFVTSNREYYVPKFVNEIQGKLRLNAKGFGFVDYEESLSVFISPPNVNGAMDNDEVSIKIFKDPGKADSYQGIVASVVARSRKYFVGRIQKFGQHLGIIPLDPRIKGRFRFEDTSGLQVDDEVKVKIIEYGPTVTIKLDKKLGHKNDVSIDILKEIEDANIKLDFDFETRNEAKKLPSEIDQADTKNRVDLREKLIVTIDGDDTKDFDDAIHVYRKDNGNFILGVHIADVSHYVKEKHPLDNEAALRGTSVYLADRVIPMLPFELSNGICSLNPQVDRLTLSAEMEIDSKGHTVDYRIFPSVIKSKFRLTYQEVNRFYRNDFSWENDELHQMLHDSLALSKIIRKYKQNEGYIDFEISESKIIIDEQGKTKDIVLRERLESEMMIEDFMVRANETVAHHTEKNKLPFIYRVHDKPDLDKVANLQNVVKTLGMEITIPQSPIPKNFAIAINQIKETRFDDFMKMMMLRTMAKAEYSPNNIGHFGLASKSYSHFTSPIRRYPDLLVHRMLRTYFFNNNKQAAKHFEEVLPELAERSSLAEQKAIDLERKVADIKKAEYYEGLIGQAFEGTILSVAKFGFFVEFENKVDGLVHISSLIDDEYKLGPNGLLLKGTKRQFTIGDKVKVNIVNVSKSEGKIDLILSDLYVLWKTKQKF